MAAERAGGCNFLQRSTFPFLTLLLLTAVPCRASADTSVDLVEISTGATATAVSQQRGQRQDIQLLARSQPGTELNSKKLIVLEKIGKAPGSPVTLPDVHAANKWLCEAAGGVLDDDYRCSKKRVYRFEDKDSLNKISAHRDAIRSVFRTPGVRSITGPRGGQVQLVYMGLPFVEWSEEWNRQASATQTYLNANRPKPTTQVPLHFLKGTELLQIAPDSCDNCFYSNRRLADEAELLKHLLDFWHSDCVAEACAKAHVLVVDDAELGTPFTCFTGAKVQMLTQKPSSRGGRGAAPPPRHNNVGQSTRRFKSQHPRALPPDQAFPISLLPPLGAISRG